MLRSGGAVHLHRFNELLAYCGPHIADSSPPSVANRAAGMTIPNLA